MPWITPRTEVSIEDALAFEEMLDQIAEADRQHRLREAYSFRLTGEGWEPAGHCPQERQPHHD